MSNSAAEVEDEVIVMGSQSDRQESTAVASSAEQTSAADLHLFVKREDDVWVCQPCKQLNKVQKWKDRSTSNFRRHLSNKHPSLYQPQSQDQSKLTHYGFNRASTIGQKRKKFDSSYGANDKKYSDTCLTKWIVNASQPFSVVEDRDFIEYIASLREQYPLPTRNTVRNRILKLWKEEKARCRMELERDCSGKRVGITTDMWTSVAKRGYMVVTLHYVDTAWQMKSVIIAFKRVLYPHTADRLAAHFVEAVQEMSPRLLPSIWAVTGDNASTNPAMVHHLNSIVPASIQSYRESICPVDANSTGNSDCAETALWNCEDRPIVLLRCVAHVLQLAVKEGLLKVPIVDVAIGHFRDLAKKINDSPKLLEALGSVCVILGIDQKAIKLDCPTRWNSTWEMISTLIDLKLPIEELLRRIREVHTGFTGFSIDPNDNLAKPINAITWTSLQEFCSFLKEFQEATVLMSGSTYPTLGLVVPVMFGIKQHVEESIGATERFTSVHTQQFAEAVKAKLDEYHEVIHQNVVIIAAALDPRVKNLLSRFGWKGRDD